jgi:hypothetical protein
VRLAKAIAPVSFIGRQPRQREKHPASQKLGIRSQALGHQHSISALVFPCHTQVARFCTYFALNSPTVLFRWSVIRRKYEPISDFILVATYSYACDTDRVPTDDMDGLTIRRRDRDSTGKARHTVWSCRQLRCCHTQAVCMGDVDPALYGYHAALCFGRDNE